MDGLGHPPYGSGMTKIAIILGSVRPQRAGEAVARWVHDIATLRGDAEFALIDLREVGLPPLDEPVAPMLGRYHQPHTVQWAGIIRPFDGFVFVTPEYNHGMPASLKNAIDFLYAEWNDKAAGFVGYGADGGIRAVEQLRQVMGQLKVADVASQVALSVFTDFVNFTDFKPQPSHVDSLNTMLSEVVSWADALKAVRG
jgi:NAD(P)H-dependent FMN reductase